MGLLDFFRRKALNLSPAVLEAESTRQLNLYRRLGGTNQNALIVGSWEQVQSETYAWMYRTQPAVRTAIDYIARNLSQLPLKCYERVDDERRETAGDHPAARTMREPYPHTRPKGWVFDFAADFLIFDNAYAVKLMGTDGQRTLVRVPPYMMAIVGNTTFAVQGYRVYRSDGTAFPGPNGMLPPEQVVHWKGYNAEDPRIGLSHLETLRATLAEEAASVTASTELLKSGLQKNGWVYRPLEAPQWSGAGRELFEQDLYNRVVRSDKRWPVLEEGMEIRDLGVTPKDAEMLKGREFTKETVNGEYGMDNVPPEDEDERKQFYADILAPHAESLAELLDLSLRDQEYGATDHYFEVDLNEKLRGDPVARFAAITSAVGAPWMTREEARALENLSPDPEGDLITPMNVIVGDNPKPAPNVMPIQDPNKPPQDGSFREEPKQLKRGYYGDDPGERDPRGRFARGGGGFSPGERVRDLQTGDRGAVAYVTSDGRIGIEWDAGTTQEVAPGSIEKVEESLLDDEDDGHWPSKDEVSMVVTELADGEERQVGRFTVGRDGDDYWLKLDGELVGDGMAPEEVGDRAEEVAEREGKSIASLAVKAQLPRRADQVARQERAAADAEAILRGIFERQSRAVKSAGGQKAVNTPKWNKQLADELLTLSRETVAREGTIHANRMASRFSMARARNYLETAALESAKAINDLTQRDLGVAKTAAEVAGVFARALSMRAPNGGMAIATGMFAWAAKEAVQQAGQEGKRIVNVRGGDCETCRPYQGDWAFKALEAWPPYHANCNCSVDIAA